tara:strand:+ start:339 stop:1151 length:813 start_codon:yes stop_codon:yes gene_type:complete
MNKEDIKIKIKELGLIQKWNHSFKLPFDIETANSNQKSHGKNLIKLERLKEIFDVIGLDQKSVLDVGCNEGFFSIFMAEKGSKVKGIDIDQNRINKANYIKSLLANSLDVSFSQMDIYSEKFKSLKKFDISLCLGFIHRIPDPYMAISLLSQKTEFIIFEWKTLKFGPHDQPFAYFSQKPIDKEDYHGTEYWILSFSALESILKRLGFKHFYRIDDPSFNRAILVAGKKYNRIFDKEDIRLHRGRLKAILSHGKRGIKTLIGIITGRINA